jgi:hypothetical protein
MDQNTKRRPKTVILCTQATRGPLYLSRVADEKIGECTGMKIGRENQSKRWRRAGMSHGLAQIRCDPTPDWTAGAVKSRRPPTPSGHGDSSDLRLRVGIHNARKYVGSRKYIVTYSGFRDKE